MHLFPRAEISLDSAYAPRVGKLSFDVARVVIAIVRWLAAQLRILSVGFALTVSVIFVFVANAEAQHLASNHPDRYTVVKGDTLWDIAGKFLRDPWQWPKVWQRNPQIENPDLIYPGDVLVLTFNSDGEVVIKSLRRETIKLTPQARVSEYRDAIPPIDPRAISAYIDSPLVTDEEEMKQAGYVVNGVDNHLIMGQYDQFYARGIKDFSADTFRLFRPGRHFVHPITGENLGWEAEHVGDAIMLKRGDPARLSIVSSNGDVAIKDRLRPTYKSESLPFFYPKSPTNRKLYGYILPNNTRTGELGPLSVVTLSIGKREGVEPGDVFRIMSRETAGKDPITGEEYLVPEERSGLVLVFRTFKKVSYAIITNAHRPISALDVVRAPKLN